MEIIKVIYIWYLVWVFKDDFIELQLLIMIVMDVQ